VEVFVMRVYVESVLPCPPDAAWEEVQNSALLLEVTRPLVVIGPAAGESLPERWRQGETVRCRSYLFGLIPLGTHTIVLERVDPDAREIQSREHDPLVRRWDHLVRVRATEDGQTRYSDEIEIEAGLLTPLVGMFARWFYRHRQRRWQAVARRLTGAAGGVSVP
jgi:hypothetical protein